MRIKPRSSARKKTGFFVPYGENVLVRCAPGNCCDFCPAIRIMPSPKQFALLDVPAENLLVGAGEDTTSGAT
jgi:hypothetical protein